MKNKKKMIYHGESLKFDSNGEPLPTESKWMEVKKSPIHALGVFAARDIPKGTKIIEYVGEKVTKKESDKRSDRDLDANSENEEMGAVYIFELDDKYDIDGNVTWNTARLINHSCNPNCETEDNDSYIWIEASRDINKGEELSYNYGYDLESYEDHPCKCGSENCVGFIVDEDHWPKLKKLLTKNK
jgi:SET domain-containing protein